MQKQQIKSKSTWSKTDLIVEKNSNKANNDVKTKSTNSKPSIATIGLEFISPATYDRLDKFLTEYYALSRAQAQKKIKDGYVIVNNSIATKISGKIHQGDILKEC